MVEDRSSRDSAIIEAEITGLNKSWAVAPSPFLNGAPVSVLCAPPQGTKGVPGPLPLKPERQLWEQGDARRPRPHLSFLGSSVFEQPQQSRQQCPLELIKVKDTGAALQKGSIQGRQTPNNTHLASNTAFLSNPQTTLKHKAC